MACQHRRLYAQLLRAFALALGALLSGSGPAFTHEGHDHGEQASTAQRPASPRVVATSEKYQFVGIVEGEVLVIYLDRTDDNSPAAGADIEVSLDGNAYKAEPQAKTATYELTAPVLRTAGSYEVLITLADGNIQDLLVGTLTVPAPRGGATTPQTGARKLLTELLPARRHAIAVAGAFLLAAALGGALLSGRKALIVPATIVGLILTSALAWAHEGHDHGTDISASAGNSPHRRPDGSLFIPKPTQRLLEVRTKIANSENRTRTARFNGRVIPNPNRSGVVQSTIQGRYLPPEGGVPALGTRVKADDLLGRIAPAFQSIDSSDMAQTLGTLDQEIALNRRKLERQEQLLAKNVVAKATVEDIRIQLEGLEKRRRDLLSARLRPEDLRAPVDGVIAAARVVAGQVVAPSDQLFQIIDPASLMVEALVFDQIDPTAVEEATATPEHRRLDQAEIPRPKPRAAEPVLGPAIPDRRVRRTARRRGSRNRNGPDEPGRDGHRDASLRPGAGAERTDRRLQPHRAGGLPAAPGTLRRSRRRQCRGHGRHLNRRADRRAQCVPAQPSAVRKGTPVFNLLVAASLKTGCWSSPPQRC